MSLAVLISSIRVQMKQSFVRPMFRFCLLANPVLNTILLYEMYRNSGEDNFMAYVVLGAGLMGLWSCICFSSAGDINRERHSGTLALIFAAPASFPAIILGKILGNTILSLVTLVISLITAVVLFQVPVMIGSPLLFLIALFGAVMAFVVISSVIACLLTLSRKTELYMNCIEIPVILLCGFVFPVTILPKAVQAISYSGHGRIILYADNKCTAIGVGKRNNMVGQTFRIFSRTFAVKGLILLFVIEFFKRI